MRQLTLVTSTILCSCLAGGLSANSIGLAKSSQEFSILRSDSSLTAGGSMPCLVQSGDKITAGPKLVRVDATSGDTILVGENSDVVLGESGTVELTKGAMAYSTSQEEPNRILVGDLLFERMGEAAAEQAETTTEADASPVGSLAIGIKPENVIEAHSFNGRFRVTHLPGGDQVAVLGMKDTMRFVRGDLGGWTPMLPMAQLEGDGSSQLEGDDDDDEGVVAWLTDTASSGGTAAVLTGVGILGIAAISYGVLSSDDSSSDDDDNGGGTFQSGPSSQIVNPNQEETNNEFEEEFPQEEIGGEVVVVAE